MTEHARASLQPYCFDLNTLCVLALPPALPLRIQGVPVAHARSCASGDEGDVSRRALGGAAAGLGVHLAVAAVHQRAPRETTGRGPARTRGAFQQRGGGALPRARRKVVALRGARVA